MLDLEIVTPPNFEDALDVVSLDEMRVHLRMRTHKRDAEIKAAIIDAVDVLGGVDGILNRTILPTRYRRYLNALPRGRTGLPLSIQLPYPELAGMPEIKIMATGTVLAPSTYEVTTGMIPMISSIGYWPAMNAGLRGVAIEYDAGYATGYPPKLKRYVKLLAAHYLENGEGTINEPRQMMINRSIAYGFEQLKDSLRVPVSYDDWTTT